MVFDKSTLQTVSNAEDAHDFVVQVEREADGQRPCVSHKVGVRKSPAHGLKVQQPDSLLLERFTWSGFELWGEGRIDSRDDVVVEAGDQTGRVQKRRSWLNDVLELRFVVVVSNLARVQCKQHEGMALHDAVFMQL